MKSHVLEATKEYIVTVYAHLFPITSNFLPRVILDELKRHYKHPSHDTMINALNNKFYRLMKERKVG